MKLIMLTDALGELFGEFDALNKISDAGFDGVDYSAYNCLYDENCIINSPNYQEQAIKYKERANSLGLKILQAHAPFSSELPLDTMFEKTIKSMEVASLMGVEIIVVHPIQNMPYHGNAELLFNKNMEFYNSLIPYCAKFNIKVATENMFQYDSRRRVMVDSVCASPEEFSKYIDTINSPYVTGCLDIGHVGLCGRNAPDAIRYMGNKRISCLHVHDNHYVDDIHALPYLGGSLNWDKILIALKDIDYKGHLTYETGGFLKKIPAPLIPATLKYMNELGREMISYFQSV